MSTSNKPQESPATSVEESTSSTHSQLGKHQDYSQEPGILPTYLSQFLRAKNAVTSTPNSSPVKFNPWTSYDGLGDIYDMEDSE